MRDSKSKETVRKPFALTLNPRNAEPITVKRTYYSAPVFLQTCHNDPDF